MLDKLRTNKRTPSPLQGEAQLVGFDPFQTSGFVHTPQGGTFDVIIGESAEDRGPQTVRAPRQAARPW